MKKTPDQIEIPEVVDENALDLFQKSNLEVILRKTEDEVRSYVGLDPSDKKDYAYMGTIAARISSLKTTIEKKGKALVDPIKAQAKEIDALRKMNKDRCDALRQEFLAPRVAYDEELAAHKKAVADAFELFNHGHLDVAEFGTTKLEDFDKMVEKFKSVEMTQSFFGDRLDEAKASYETGLYLLEQRRERWIEDEKLREAGRAELKRKEDEAAAQRHHERLKSEQEKAPDDSKASAKNAIYGQLVNYGMPKENAKKFVLAIANRQIKHLEINYVL